MCHNKGKKGEFLSRIFFKEGSTESQARREVLTVRSSSDHASKAVANCALLLLTNQELFCYNQELFCYKMIVNTPALTWSDGADTERMTGILLFIH